MPVLAVIPARGGSVRFPRKNVARLDGSPLVVRCLDTCLEAAAIDRVVVSSDDAEILALAGQRSHHAPVRRPAALSTDRAPVIQAVRHAVDVVEAQESSYYDVIAIVQCTSPFTAPEDLDGLIAELQLNPEADSAVSVVELAHHLHPDKLQRLEDGWVRRWSGGATPDMRPAESLEACYIRNGSAYACRRSVLEGGAILTDRCRGYIMPAERSTDINTPLDLEWAEFILSRTAGAGARHPER